MKLIATIMNPHKYQNFRFPVFGLSKISDKTPTIGVNIASTTYPTSKINLNISLNNSWLWMITLRCNLLISQFQLVLYLQESKEDNWTIKHLLGH